MRARFAAQVDREEMEASDMCRVASLPSRQPLFTWGTLAACVMQCERDLPEGTPGADFLCRADCETLWCCAQDVFFSLTPRPPPSPSSPPPPAPEDEWPQASPSPSPNAYGRRLAEASPAPRPAERTVLEPRPRPVVPSAAEKSLFFSSSMFG